MPVHMRCGNTTNINAEDLGLSHYGPHLVVHLAGFAAVAATGDQICAAVSGRRGLYPRPIDDEPGPGSERALVTRQRQEGLVVDTRIGPGVLERLRDTR